ncbi:HD domain-containing protein [Mucilaginibacter litoreus]|uniref:HD domain-containing protein n=1 Tax=Mucilaginibacter litoreus TaxID=1048221 RepID=A0ABW3AMB2_9SPHI
MIDSPEGKYILTRLRYELPGHFHYHNIDHTLDVYHSAEAIAIQEYIDGETTRLLLIAALYHDSGYLKQISEHEKASCAIAREALVDFGYTAAEIDAVCSIIMATQLPQQPKTLPEQIICDADLDYLGRTDFITTGNRLFEEMKALGSIGTIDDWNKLQVDFLKTHHYFTKTAVENREPKKQENLRALQNKTFSLK